MAATVWHHLQAMLKFLALMYRLLCAALRDRAGLVADNLVLRHQLAALTRSL